MKYSNQELMARVVQLRDENERLLTLNNSLVETGNSLAVEVKELKLSLSLREGEIKCVVKELLSMQAEFAVRFETIKNILNP